MTSFRCLWFLSHRAASTLWSGYSHLHRVLPAVVEHRNDRARNHDVIDRQPRPGVGNGRLRHSK